MLTIDIIGGNGLIGSAIKRTVKNMTIRDWGINSKSYGYFNLMDENSWDQLFSNDPKYIILLSWPGLPNYMEDFHILNNLTMSIRLLSKLLEKNISKILVAGTCYEYGLVDGKVNENVITKPITKYGLAKDTLRAYLEIEAQKHNIDWCWLRIFYPYSDHAIRPTLYNKLLKAINNNDKYFELGSGNQVRDFILVDNIAIQIVDLLLNPYSIGIYNSGSGTPFSVREFANSIVKSKNSNIELRFGVYKDREYEPKSFWADMEKYNILINKHKINHKII